MPAQRTTSRGGNTTRRTANNRGANNKSSTPRKPTNNGTGRRNNRAAFWPIELSMAGGIEITVEGQNGDSFGIAVCSLCAAILPGSEVSQQLHRVWHETVAQIAGGR